VAEWASKLHGAVLRLAGLFHLAERAHVPTPWAEPVRAETVEAAIQLAEEFLIPHARVALAAAGADPVVTGAEYVLDRIRKHGQPRLAERELYHLCRGALPTMEDLKPALDLLIKHGFLRQTPVELKHGPGRPKSPMLEVDPIVFTESARPPQHGQGELSSGSCGDYEDPDEDGWLAELASD
jgi:hypothetical protein